MCDIKKVENPVYQEMEDIASSYWNNWLLISNLTNKPDGGVVLGRIPIMQVYNLMEDFGDSLLEKKYSPLPW